MKKSHKIFIGLYIAGAILTNSYLRQFRYKMWYKQNPSNLHVICDNDASFRCAFGTIFWPVYLTARLTDQIVNVVAYTNIKVESPEILK